MSNLTRRSTSMSTRVITLLVALSPFLGACGDPPAGPSADPTSMFQANITGAEETTFNGSGYYMVGPPPERPFSMSASVGRPDGSGHGFLIFGDGGRPSVGRHAIGLAPGTLKATYVAASNGADLTAYAAAAGEVDIVSATADRLEGTFQFDGFRYCRIQGAETEGPCRVPEEPITGVPVIEVTGSFSVIDHHSVPILEVVVPATIQFYQEPVRIEVPASVERGQRFQVSVYSYGDGCTSFARTDISISGTNATVSPYDRELRGGACTQQLVLVEHTAELVFAAPGTARITFKGWSRPADRAVEFVRTVQVR